MARRKGATITLPLRVEAGGEWVELKTSVSYEELLKLDGIRAAGMAPEAVAQLLAALIHGWSLVGDDDQPLPITEENVADNKDAEVITEAFLSLNDLPFLARRSRPQNRKF